MKNLLIFLLCITAFAGCKKADYLFDYRRKFVGEYAVHVREQKHYSDPLFENSDTTYIVIATVDYGGNDDLLTISIPSQNYPETATVKKDGTLFNPDGGGKIKDKNLHWASGFHGGTYLYSLNIDGVKVP